MRGRLLRVAGAAFVAAALAVGGRAAAASEAGKAANPEKEGSRVPTGQFVTPLAAPGARFTKLDPHLPGYPDHGAGQAISEALSPDGRTLLVLTSGYNRLNGANHKRDRGASEEYVFVYAVGGKAPSQRQVIRVPNTFAGIAFAPDGKHFYVSGGRDDDVHVFSHGKEGWREDTPPIRLGHRAGVARVPPVAAGLAATADGKKLVVANYANDSVSVVDLAARRVAAEVDLRPGKAGGASGTPGGEYPFWVAIQGSQRAWVSSLRDREVVGVDLAADPPRVVRRVPVAGNPNKMVLDRSGKRLYVAADNSDVVNVIDTALGVVVAKIQTLAPPGTVRRAHDYKGVAPNGLALSPDGTRLYVTNGGTNSVAVIALSKDGGRVVGLIPTGWYPQAVAASRVPPMLYVVNAKSAAGPKPPHGGPARRRNAYVLQLEEAGFLSLPIPSQKELAVLTQQVAANNGFHGRASPHDREVMATLHARIHHVIYVIKENRTYDQVLGDLPGGNGDAHLAMFGEKVTPNLHALARDFVNLDNTYATGEVSGNGWPWSTEARETDIGEKTIPMVYARRGPTYDVTGLNRDVNVGLPTPAKRRAWYPGAPSDPDVLPGTNDVGAPDGPDGEKQEGYLWSSALRAGLTVRNYGFYGDTILYVPRAPGSVPLIRDPAAKGTRVMFPTSPQLMGISDPYFRSFDLAFPDFYREREWEREFVKYVSGGDLPALSLVWLSEDHMGAFGRAIDGVNRPKLQQADNDYAVGRLVEAVAKSPYRKDTLIFVIEDDAQSGPDHVDAHRTTAYVVGPYVKHHAVVSHYYTTVNLLRTIEDVLGIEHLSIFDADEAPMTDVFDPSQKEWSFEARPSALLADTELPIPKEAFGAEKTTGHGGTAERSIPKEASGAQGESGGGAVAGLTHSAAWWAARTKGMNFTEQDRLDADAFNRLLWAGLEPGRPYPTERSGADLRPRGAP